MPKTKTRKSTKSPKFSYSVEVKVNDFTFKGSANSMEQALRDLTSNPDFPYSVKTKFVLNASKGDEKILRIFGPLQAHRMFKGFALKPDLLTIYAQKLEHELNG